MSKTTDDTIDFTFLVEFLISFVQFFKRSVRLLFSYLIVGVVLSVLIKVILPPVFESNFGFKVNENQDMFFISMLYDLQVLSENQDYPALSRELKINVSDVENIKSIKFLPLFTSGRKDSVHSIVVTLNLKDTGLFIPLQSSILNYLESSEHYTKLRTKRVYDFLRIKERNLSDLKEMDSVKNIIVKNISPPKTNGGMVYNVPLNPYSAMAEEMNKYRETMWLENELKNPKSFELIKPCVISSKPVGPKLVEILKISIPVIFLIGLIHSYKKFSIH